MPIPVCRYARYDFAVGRPRPHANRHRRTPGCARPQIAVHSPGHWATPFQPVTRTGTLGEQMTEQPSAVEGSGLAPAPRLEPNAIGVAQDTVIGMASSAPAATIGLSLAALAAATAYGSGPILLLTAIPMLVIANAYRRCNMWNANCGASFEWVGRAINPDLGFLTGWLMVVAYIIGTVAEILLLGPSVLAVFGSTSTNTWAWIAIGSVVGVIMLIIAVVGIKITAKTQVGMAF